MVNLSVRGTCVSEVVREWSEFGSEFRSEFELEWGPVDFLIMVVVSESEIILKSLLSALITSMASAILSRGKDCEVPKLVGKWSEFGSKFRSELELELGIFWWCLKT